MPSDLVVDNAALGRPPDSKQIRDRFLNRLLVRAGVWTTRRFQDRSRPVLTIAPTIFVKYCSFRDLGEARAIQYLVDLTSIPGPNICCCFQLHHWRAPTVHY